MTIILFLKIIYICSCICMIYPNIEFYKDQGYATIENAIWTILLTFLPVVNTCISILHLVDKINLERFLEFKLWESK